MRQIFIITFKGIFRDRVLRGIAMSSLFFLLVPSVSSLSMRQVVELSITLSLSLISVMMLLLSVFLGGSSLVEGHGTPVYVQRPGFARFGAKYLFGKFIGTAAFLFLAALLLKPNSAVVVKYVSVLYPPMRPVVWPVLFFSIFFIALKYILLVAFAFMLSTVSTSFFLPIFGTLAVFFAGSAAQRSMIFFGLRRPKTTLPL